MNYDDLLKDTNPEIIDAEKLFDDNGVIIEGYVDIVTAEKPLLPPVKQEDRFKFFSVKENRDRYTDFPDRLPTNNLMPYPVDAHEHIGEYENKHNLYLTTANAYNKLIERIEALEQEVQNLKNNANPV